MCKLDVQALRKAGEGQNIQKALLGGNIDFIKWLDMSDGLWQEHVGLFSWGVLHFQLNWPSGVLFGLSIIGSYTVVVTPTCMSCCVAIFDTDAISALYIRVFWISLSLHLSVSERLVDTSDLLPRVLQYAYFILPHLA